MFTCPPNLAHSFLTICKIITFKVDKEDFFPNAKGGQHSFEYQRTTFSSRHGLWNILFLSLSDLGICLQNLIPRRGVEHWEKNYCPQGVMLKFTFKGHFWTIKKAYSKLLYWKFKWWAHALVHPQHTRFFIFLKNKIKSQFVVVFQSSLS
jgi:hypothetical protein